MFERQEVRRKGSNIDFKYQRFFKETVRNENVRFVSSRDRINEDSMVMQSKIDGNLFLPQDPKKS